MTPRGRRGTGYADSVPEDGMSQFKNLLTEAGQAATEAWTAEPTCARAAEQMITVEKGAGSKREEMEKWFERAMKANPNDKYACMLKLDYLHPKWNGSVEDMLEFGRQCRETKNWRSGIPLIFADAHYEVAKARRAEGGRTTADYFKDRKIAQDVHDVYQEYLSHRPNDYATRTRCACILWICSAVPEAHRQFERWAITSSHQRSFRWIGSRKPRNRWRRSWRKKKPSGRISEPAMTNPYSLQLPQAKLELLPLDVSAQGQQGGMADLARRVDRASRNRGRNRAWATLSH